MYCVYFLVHEKLIREVAFDIMHGTHNIKICLILNILHTYIYIYYQVATTLNTTLLQI